MAVRTISHWRSQWTCDLWWCSWYQLPWNTTV